MSTSRAGADQQGTEPDELVPVDDRRVYIDLEDRARGDQEPFYAAYSDADGTRRYGWFCGHCESTETNMDPMGHIVCAGCGNRRKPTRWDAAYL